MSTGHRWSVPEHYSPPELLAVLWRLHHGERVTEAELWTHPIGGIELRIHPLVPALAVRVIG